MTTALAEFLRKRIAADGMISVADYMATCLYHPQWGYYRRKDPLGAAGDFVTAPEISQMFGELIGLWASVVWRSMGEPADVVLAELGPGRGTLMADFLRAARLVPAFRKALRVHLVEISPALRARQQQLLLGEAVHWCDDVQALPDGPLIVVANEFFDALPISQYVLRADGWHERCIVERGGKLAFTDGPAVGIVGPPATDGEVFEINKGGCEIAAWLARRLTSQGGTALIVDYGHAISAPGDTLQAVRWHKPVPVLETPGDADLTAHVDFQALAESATGVSATDVVTQGAFLRSLGIELRAERLISATPQKAGVVRDACQRLIRSSGMGTLFKVRAFTHPGLPTPPGFVR